MNTSYTIVGLGATGLSVARYLAQQGQTFAVADSFAKPEQVSQLQAIAPEVVLRTGDFDADWLAQAETLVVNPGIAVATPAIASARQQGSRVIGDIELFAKAVPKKSKLAAVTGSNGKSTCVTLLYEMAKQAGLNVKLGGNIGTPALDLLTDNTADLYVLELSSYQLETTDSLDCDVACILNISPDHLDRYENYQGYIHAKKRLLAQTQKVVVFADDPEIASWQQEAALHFSLQPPKDGNQFGVLTHDEKPWLAKGTQRLLAVEDMALTGMHNAANALAALAMGEALGLPMSAMLETVQTFGGLKHRMQQVADIHGVRWINDSKATNVGASVAALLGLASGKKDIILLAGGQTKKADLAPLCAAMGGVKQVLLFGEDAPLLQAVLKECVPCTLVEDLHTACEHAQALAREGDRVLLSPAGASFDQFENFAVRGEAFIAWVTQQKEVRHG